MHRAVEPTKGVEETSSEGYLPKGHAFAGLEEYGEGAGGGRVLAEVDEVRRPLVRTVVTEHHAVVLHASAKSLERGNRAGSEQQEDGAAKDEVG